MQPGKTKIKTGLCEPTVPTNQMRSSNGAGRVGKVLRAKTQNFPCRWENHEWTTTAQARQITSEKFLLAAWAVRNFLHCCLVRKIQFSSLSLRSANENYYFSYPTTPHDTGIRRSVVLYCGNAKTPRPEEHRKEYRAAHEANSTFLGETLLYLS